VSIGTTAALVVGGLGAAGNLGSSLIGSNAAGKAAAQESQAAQAGINETQQQYQQTQAALAPYLQAGTGALSLLSQGIQPGGSLVTPYGPTYQTPAAFTPAAPFSYAAFQAPAPFTSPTTVDEQNDPGYQFRLQQSQQALERGAAAGGGALSGGTLQALQQSAQDYASNEYQNVYSRALNNYNTNFNTALAGYNTNFGGALNAYNTNAANALAAYNTNVNTGLNAYNTQFNAYNTGQGNAFNRLAALAGIGQGAAGTLAGAGANNAAAIANLLTGQGSAQAAGTLGSAGAWNSGLNAITGNPFLTGGLASLISGSSKGPNNVGSGEAPQYNQVYTGGAYQPGDD
jgi:hypothetical protein